VKPAAFEYLRPRTLDEAVAALAEHGDAAVPLAGGQSLLPLMNLRLAQPELLLDLNGIDELDYIKADAEMIAIGALARQRDVERSPVVRRACPLLVRALEHVGNPQIRNRGTVIGNLVHADPTSELPAVMVALEATIVLVAGSGPRKVEAADFFLGPLATARNPDELVAEVRFRALGAGDGWGFEELAPAFTAHPLVAAAAVVRATNKPRVALAGVAGRPLLVTAPSDLESVGDEFTRAVASELGRRALERAARPEVFPQ
jgi:CO/xanthine dehydrogenase FAD-binding subunit